jgi:hypothetical protein
MQLTTTGVPEMSQQFNGSVQRDSRTATQQAEQDGQGE